MADADPSQVLSDMSGKSGGSPLDSLFSQAKAVQAKEKDIRKETDAAYRSEERRVGKEC